MSFLNLTYSESSVDVELAGTTVLTRAFADIVESLRDRHSLCGADAGRIGRLKLYFCRSSSTCRGVIPDDLRTKIRDFVGFVISGISTTCFKTCNSFLSTRSL